jgi:hypothetical protein
MISALMAETKSLNLREQFCPAFNVRVRRHKRAHALQSKSRVGWHAQLQTPTTIASAAFLE